MQLCVLQVGPHHKLQHLEKLAVRNEPVLVDVVDLETNCK
jgi:hypothetical protein